MLEFFSRQRGLRYSQEFSCLPCGSLFLQGIGDNLLFLLIHELIKINGLCSCYFMAYVHSHFSYHISVQEHVHRIAVDGTPFFGNIQSVYCVFKFTDIARPVIFFKLPVCITRKALFYSVSLAVILQENPAETISALLSKPEILQEMSNNCKGLCQGNSCEQIINLAHSIGKKESEK